MRKIHVLFACALAALIYACGSEKETVVTEVPVLRASDLYEAKAVNEYLLAYADSHKNMAVSYLKKADAIREVNIAKSIYYTKRALTLYPTLESYEKLGALLAEAGNYDEASSVYSLINQEHTIFYGDMGQIDTFLFNVPDEKRYYETIAMDILKDETLNGYYLNYAEEIHLDVKDLKQRFENDKRIALDRQSEAYKNIMLQFMSEDEIKAFISSPENFSNFIKAIPDSIASFNIGMEEVSLFRYSRYYDEYEWGDWDDFSYRGSISDHYIHFLKEKQDNPEKWYDFNLKNRVKINDSVCAVLYAIDTSDLASPLQMRHIYHHLVTYNNMGKIISDAIIAWQSGEELGTVTYNKDYFTITSYKRTWKKPYKKGDFDNYLVKTEETGKKSYFIADDGRIEEEQVMQLETVALPL